MLSYSLVLSSMVGIVKMKVQIGKWEQKLVELLESLKYIATYVSQAIIVMVIM